MMERRVHHKRREERREERGKSARRKNADEIEKGTKGAITLGKFSMDLQSQIINFCPCGHTTTVVPPHFPSTLPWS